MTEEVKQKIYAGLQEYLRGIQISSASVDKLRDVNRSLGFKTGSEYGYHLRDDEVAGLKQLIRTAFEVDYYPDGDIDKAWQQFCSQHNIQ